MHTVRVLCDAILSEHVSVRNTNLYTTQRRADRPPRSCRRRSSHTSRRPPSELDQDTPRIGIPHASRYANRLRAHMGCRPKSNHAAASTRPRRTDLKDDRGLSRRPAPATLGGGRGKRRRRPPPSVISPRSLAAHFQAVSHLPPAMPQGPVHLLAKAAAHQ